MAEIGRAGAAEGLAGSSKSYSQLALINKGIAAGPGGRSSVSGLTATVFGCSGFLGRYVVQALARMGSQVVVPYRCDELDVQHLRPMGDLGQMVMMPDFDMRDPEMIELAISKSNVVVNLLGARRDTWNFKMEEVNTDFARAIAQAAAANGSVERLLHVSCLAASEDAPSRHLRSKAAGEAAVREAFPQATVFKAAHLVGQEDDFTNAYATSGKRAAVCTLVDGGYNRIQPLHVRDVADAMLNSLKSKEPVGKTYHLAGPEVFTMRDFTRIIYEAMREPFAPVYVPASFAKATGGIWDWLSTKAPPLPVSSLMYADYAAEQTIDHVLPANAADMGLLTIRELGIDPVPMTVGGALEHIRHMRAGGYDFGTTLEDAPVPRTAPRA